MTANRSRSVGTDRFVRVNHPVLLHSSPTCSPQEVEPTIGEKLCRLWLKVDSDDDSLSATSGRLFVRNSGSRGGGNNGSSAGSHTHIPPPSYPQSQHHMPPYLPPHPAYPPYHPGYHPIGHMFPPTDRSRLPPHPQSHLMPYSRLGQHPPYRGGRPWWPRGPTFPGGLPLPPYMHRNFIPGGSHYGPPPHAYHHPGIPGRGEVYAPQNHDIQENGKMASKATGSPATTSSPLFHPQPSTPKSQHHYSALRPRESKNFSASVQTSKSSVRSSRRNEVKMADGPSSSGDKPVGLSTDESRDSDNASSVPDPSAVNLASEDHCA